jgi:K+ transporter
MRNGIWIIGGSALLILIFTHGSIELLVLLYSINVFITFVLSQAGMVAHWWQGRRTIKKWFKGFMINGIGLVLTSFILISMVVLKFHDGGWVTLFITSILIALAVAIKQHYLRTKKLLSRLDNLLAVVQAQSLQGHKHDDKPVHPDYNARTAVIFVSGYNSLGLHTLFNVIRYLGDNTFKNYIFAGVGIVDSANFSTQEKMEEMKSDVRGDLRMYIEFMNREGFYAETISAIGTDIVDEALQLVPQIQKRFNNVVFFGGQLTFRRNLYIHRWLHNYTALRLQKAFYDEAIPFFVVPIRVV